MISAESTVTRIELIRLREPAFISLLRSFKSVLKTSVGPEGNFKLLVSGGGYTQLSSSSSQILQHHDQFDSPLVQFIAQIMKGQSDFGLYCGLIITSSLEHMLSLQIDESFTPKQSINFFNVLIRNLINIFTADKLKIRINFDSGADFIPLVQSILRSKCNTSLTNNSSSELCIQIIKAFLYTLDVDRVRVGKVMTHIIKGNEECKFYPGIVYQLTDDDIWVSHLIEKSQGRKKVIKSLLFTTPLNCISENSGNIDGGEQLRMSKIFEILEAAVDLGVELIVCQKVVHSDFVLFLRRKSVIILERLGTSLANNFEQLSGSFPISDIDRLSSDNISSMIGSVDNISTLAFSSDLYLLMDCQSANIGTLMIKTSCLGGTHQIKTLIEQALQGLRALISEPTVCPGAGCFETSLFIHLQELCKVELSPHDMKWLFNVLLEACGCSLPVWVDSYYNHAWATETQMKCNCRLISKCMVLNNGGLYRLVSLSDEVFYFDSELFTNRCQSAVELTSDCVVDSFVHKRSSIMVSFESCINLLNIGNIVCRKTC